MKKRAPDFSGARFALQGRDTRYREMKFSGDWL